MPAPLVRSFSGSHRYRCRPGHTNSDIPAQAAIPACWHAATGRLPTLSHTSTPPTDSALRPAPPTPSSRSQSHASCRRANACCRRANASSPCIDQTLCGALQRTGVLITLSRKCRGLKGQPVSGRHPSRGTRQRPPPLCPHPRGKSGERQHLHPTFGCAIGCGCGCGGLSGSGWWATRADALCGACGPGCGCGCDCDCDCGCCCCGYGCGSCPNKT
jgi:hypothetical protein